MYVKRNNLARSHNQYCSVRAITITYSESVLVALCIQLAMRMRLIVICGLCHIFPHILVNGKIFGKPLIEHELCFDLLYHLHLKHFSFVEEFSKILS
jgi:hypothetical protein